MTTPKQKDANIFPAWFVRHVTKLLITKMFVWYLWVTGTCYWVTFVRESKDSAPPAFFPRIEFGAALAKKHPYLAEVNVFAPLAPKEKPNAKPR